MSAYSESKYCYKKLVAQEGVFKKMKNFKYTKEILSLIGVVGVFFGLQLYRQLADRYGDKSGVIIVGICFAGIFIITISLIFMKKYLGALCCALGFDLPLFIAFIGIYLDNIIIMCSAIASVFIMVPVVTKVANKYKK